MLIEIATILAIIATILAWFSTYGICFSDSSIYKTLYGNFLYKFLAIILIGCSIVITVLTYLLIVEVFI